VAKAKASASSSGRFILLAPTAGEDQGDDATTLGHDQVGQYSSLDEARPHAFELAIQVGRQRDVRVWERGTNHVVSFQYHPEEPRFAGLTAAFEAILDWPVWIREISDDSERVPNYVDGEGKSVAPDSDAFTDRNVEVSIDGYDVRGGLNVTDHPEPEPEGGEQ
jgi:hypothetical protein